MPSTKDKWTIIKELLCFFALCFLLTWSFGALLAIGPDWLTSQFGQVDLEQPAYRAMFILAVWVPSLLGIGLTYAFRGQVGLSELFSRLFKWRVGIWWLIIGLGVPLYFFATEWLFYDLLEIANKEARYNILPFGWLVSFIGGSILLDPGPLGEEAGWRGFALPRLAEIMPFWWANALLAVLWGLWHIPAFLIASASQSDANFFLFMIGIMGLAFAMGATYRATGGSVLLAGWLLHVFANEIGDASNLHIDIMRWFGLAAIFILLARRFARKADAP